jgi:hypothetical protein
MRKSARTTASPNAQPTSPNRIMKSVMRVVYACEATLAVGREPIFA